MNIRVKKDKYYGLIVENRYEVKNKIGEGTFGSVYDCYDRQDPQKQLVVKISLDKNIAENEVKAIEKINITAKNFLPHLTGNFPEIIHKGSFVMENSKCKNYEKAENHYMFIMTKFGQTIEKL